MLILLLLVADFCPLNEWTIAVRSVGSQHARMMMMFRISSLFSHHQPPPQQHYFMSIWNFSKNTLTTFSLRNFKLSSLGWYFYLAATQIIVRAIFFCAGEEIQIIKTKSVKNSFHEKVKHTHGCLFLSKEHPSLLHSIIF